MLLVSGCKTKGNVSEQLDAAAKLKVGFGGFSRLTLTGLKASCADIVPPLFYLENQIEQPFTMTRKTLGEIII